jgi:hypothetical protein
MDDLTDQLHRYADAAEERAAELDVELTATTGTDRPVAGRHRHRRLLAAAAAVAVVAAGAGVFLIGQDDHRVSTTPTEPGVGDCPAPGEDGPRIGDLRMALPWVTSADLILSTEDRVTYVLGRGGPRQVRIALADFGGEPEDPGAPLPGGFPRTTVSVCDPFAGSTPTELPAAVISPHTALEFHPGGRWTVSMYADAQSEVTTEDLKAIAAGMSWPSTQRPVDTCAAVGQGTPSVTITDLPDGAALEGDGLSARFGGTGEGLTQFTRLDSGAAIDVAWFGSVDPPAMIRSAVGDDVEDATVAGCVPTGDGTWTEGEVPVVIARTADRIIVAGQLDDDEAWMVTGSDGATEAQVLQVARGLRP